MGPRRSDIAATELAAANECVCVCLRDSVTFGSRSSERDAALGDEVNPCGIQLQ